MTDLRPALALSLFAGLAPAQGLTAPPGYTTLAGESYNHYFGAFRQARFQFGEGTLRGRAVLFRRVEYRLDTGRTYNAANRSWADVKLRLGYCQVGQMSSTFTANALTTANGAPGDPTLVFGSATGSTNVAWPRVNGTDHRRDLGQGGALRLRTALRLRGCAARPAVRLRVPRRRGRARRHLGRQPLVRALPPRRRREQQRPVPARARGRRSPAPGTC